MILKGITVYRDGSRHTQVLHMTSENAEKTFDVIPSTFVTNYIAQNIKNSYIRTQVDEALRLKTPEEVPQETNVTDTSCGILIGNAIAKTINMPHDVSANDVKASYLLAHEMGLKGITVYRDGSRHKQVLHMTSENAKKTFDVIPSAFVTDFIASNIKNSYIRTQVDEALRFKTPEELPQETSVVEEVSEETLCPTCKNNLVFVEGCSLCIECGYSGCTSG